MADAPDDATALAARVRRREVQPLELVETSIAAIEKVNPKLNAVIHRMYDQARAAARAPLPDGPFRGVPFVVKDLDGWLAGEPYTQSCRMTEHFVRFAHPEGVDILVQQQPITWDGARLPLALAPSLGEHNEEVVRNLLGCSHEQFIDLLVAGVIY